AGSGVLAADVNPATRVAPARGEHGDKYFFSTDVGPGPGDQHRHFQLAQRHLASQSAGAPARPAPILRRARGIGLDHLLPRRPNVGLFVSILSRIPAKESGILGRRRDPELSGGVPRPRRWRP